jgi:hypothetical protein
VNSVNGFALDFGHGLALGFVKYHRQCGNSSSKERKKGQGSFVKLLFVELIRIDQYLAQIIPQTHRGDMFSLSSLAVMGASCSSGGPSHSPAACYPTFPVTRKDQRVLPMFQSVQLNIGAKQSVFSNQQMAVHLISNFNGTLLSDNF